MTLSTEKAGVTVAVAPSDQEDTASDTVLISKDELHLARLGYRQTFKRGLGMVESWATSFTTMNYVSGLPLLFSFAMTTGGPQAALANWTMVGGLASLVSLSLAEIAAAYPTAGGIYYWSYRLGGDSWGPFLAWLTAWWSWSGWLFVVPGAAQGGTNFLVAALQLIYPEAEFVTTGWFSWVVTSASMIIGFIPNVISQGALIFTLRIVLVSFLTLFVIYWVWLPVEVARHGKFQNTSILHKFYNGINLTPEAHASDAYCWAVGVLFGAWQFYGYDAPVRCSEETKNASSVVARGMYGGILWTWLMSVPTLIIILLCIQDFDAIVAATYRNNWAEYLVQIVGKEGAIAILILCFVDTAISTAISFMSAQRITFAIARDGVLPGSKYFSRVTKSARMPLNAGILVLLLCMAIAATIIGSFAAFGALTATATIAVHISYLIPIIARHTVGKRDFVPAKWNLSRFSPYIGSIAMVWICFLVVVLSLPQVYPVTATSLNYAPIAIGGISILSLAGWIFPFKLGARYWFKGPQRTISEYEISKMRVKDDLQA